MTRIQAACLILGRDASEVPCHGVKRVHSNLITCSKVVGSFHEYHSSDIRCLEMTIGQRIDCSTDPHTAWGKDLHVNYLNMSDNAHLDLHSCLCLWRVQSKALLAFTSSEKGKLLSLSGLRSLLRCYIPYPGKPGYGIQQR